MAASTVELELLVSSVEALQKHQRHEQVLFACESHGTTTGEHAAACKGGMPRNSAAVAAKEDDLASKARAAASRRTFDRVGNARRRQRCDKVTILAVGFMKAVM